MALWLCEGCGTLYAVGLFRCPRCHSEAFHEFGSKPEDEEHPMAKITVQRGVSDATAAPEDEAASVAAVDESAGEATGDGTGRAGPSRPRVSARKDEWITWGTQVGYNPAVLDRLTKESIQALPDYPAFDDAGHLVGSGDDGALPEAYLAAEAELAGEAAPADEEDEGAEDEPDPGADEG